jgi:hypothetical protein
MTHTTGILAIGTKVRGVKLEHAVLKDGKPVALFRSEHEAQAYAARLNHWHQKNMGMSGTMLDEARIPR